VRDSSVRTLEIRQNPKNGQNNKDISADVLMANLNGSAKIKLINYPYRFGGRARGCLRVALAFL